VGLSTFSGGATLKRRLTSLNQFKNSIEAERELNDVIKNTDLKGRGSKLSAEVNGKIESIISYLESSQSESPVDPIYSPAIDGCWKLLYTSSPGTNSPIQRTFTAFDSIGIYQVINLINTTNSFLPGCLPDVSNTVIFNNQARLRVTALASTARKPIIVPRRGDGRILGLNLFGVSSSAAPRRPTERIDFSFQEARFEFNSLPWSIPYPVPFKLLGDEAKGWIDVTYLSGRFRVSRGNKGTVFLLEKVGDPSMDGMAQFALRRLDADAIISENSSPSTVETLVMTKSSATPLIDRRRVADNNLPMWSALSEWIDRLSAAALDQRKNVPKSDVTCSSKRIAIIFPAQLGTKDDYKGLEAVLSTLSNGTLTAYTAPLERINWPVGLLPSFFSSNYVSGTLKPNEVLGFYFNRIDEAIARAYLDNLNEERELEFVLVGHSIGGWIARAWLSGHAPIYIRDRVRSLITLGTPHKAPPSGSALDKFDQTRGLLSFINDNYPGAFDPRVKYVSVIGSEVTGQLNVFNPTSLLAYVSYLFLSGKGLIAGDGIIPIEASELSGANSVVCQNVRHTNYIPTLLGRSINLPWKWYGSEDIVQQWIGLL